MERKMLTQQERIEEIHRRSAENIRRQRKVRARVIGASAFCVSLTLVIVFAFKVPVIMENGMTGGTPGFPGSILADSPAAGFIVVGLLAFLLGVTVTLLCHCLHKWSSGQGPEDRDWLK